MNIIKTGTCYHIYDDSVVTLDKLPVGTYELKDSMTGMYLEEVTDMDTRGEKVYGDHEKKIGRIFKAYETNTTKNVGVILSGGKGIGKTLFAKMCAAKAISKKMPVICINSYINSIPQFVKNITQDCMFLFDEFDKNFVSNSSEVVDKTAAQDNLLTMFDGVYSGHKIFMITCNDVDKLSDFYISRPGRFRYHLSFDCPGKEEVRAYMSDRLGKDSPEIEKVVRFSCAVPLTYDCLSAIADEISLGETFSSAMEILNIVRLDSGTAYKVMAIYRGPDGETSATYIDYSLDIDMYTDDETQAKEEWIRSFRVRIPELHTYEEVTIGRFLFSVDDIRKNGEIGSGGVVTMKKVRLLPTKIDDSTDEGVVINKFQKSVKLICVKFVPLSNETNIGRYSHMIDM